MNCYKVTINGEDFKAISEFQNPEKKCTCFVLFNQDNEVKVVPFGTPIIYDVI
jgi:hypothetical protein